MAHTFDSTTLQVRNVSITIGDKKILKNVNVTAKSGAMLAVMGPSGSGKTSLMNFMCDRKPPNSSVEGGMFLDGRKLTSKDVKLMGYVTQEDVFFPQLTLGQTLWFYSQVKLPSSMTSEEKRRRVHEVAGMLELTKCMGTAMGDSSNKGLSGGEKKRANIACELLRRPQILLLDEPTSGLDASLALKVVQMLAKWAADANSIVVASIHQPSSQTFQEFTELLLLVEGQIGYFGHLKQMSQYFRSIGIEFCADWNAADSMLEAVKESSEHRQLVIDKGVAFTGKTDNESVKSNEVHVNLSFDETDEVDKAATAGNGAATDAVTVELHSSKHGYSVKQQQHHHHHRHHSQVNTSSWFTQFIALSFRSFLVSKDSILSIHVIVQSLFVTAVASVMWFQLDRVEDNLNEFFAAVFFITSYMVFAPFFDAIMTFYSDLLVVKHERKSGMYRISAYYLAKMIVDVPLLLVTPLITLTPIFWAVGFGSFGVYVAFTAVVTLNSLASQGIGIMFSLFTEDARTNMTFAFVFMIFCFLTGGFFSTRMPIWFDWSKYLSYIRYCYHFALWLIVDNIGSFKCATTHPSAYTACINANSTELVRISGSDVLHQHPDSFLPQWVNVVVAVGMFFGFRLGGYLLLRFVRKV